VTIFRTFWLYGLKDVYCVVAALSGKVAATPQRLPVHAWFVWTFGSTRVRCLLVRAGARACLPTYLALLFPAPAVAGGWEFCVSGGFVPGSCLVRDVRPAVRSPLPAAAGSAVWTFPATTVVYNASVTAEKVRVYFFISKHLVPFCSELPLSHLRLYLLFFFYLHYPSLCGLFLNITCWFISFTPHTRYAPHIYAHLCVCRGPPVTQLPFGYAGRGWFFSSLLVLNSILGSDDVYRYAAAWRLATGQVPPAARHGDNGRRRAYATLFCFTSPYAFYRVRSAYAIVRTCLCCGHSTWAFFFRRFYGLRHVPLLVLLTALRLPSDVTGVC